MWISKATFEKLIEDRSIAQGEARALAERVQAQNATLEMFAIRTQQLEHERAVMLDRYLGVKIAVPTLRTAAPEITADDLLNSMPSFEDIGDEEAAKQGIGWEDDTGRVVYAKKA